MVESVQCKGKFIYFTMYNEHGYFYMLHSLRLTGRWQNYKDTNCRCCVTVNNDIHLWFRNPRCLATIEFTEKENNLQNILDNLGPDVLTDDFSLPKWKDIVSSNKNRNITAVLMDQTVLSGIGNYIKAEALNYSKISPLRKAGSLSVQEIGKLYEGIRLIPRIVYNKKGLELSDFVEYGNQTNDYKEDLKIYGKNQARKTKTPDGRTTYWDPNIQK